tara:strand:- start:1178 stop:1936 length:759 start_codon:yes stop_codon:yes gene_type:complete
MVPGTKADPHKVKCGAIQVDGMALEFNIDPALSQDEFVHNTSVVLTTLRKMVPKDFDFSYEACAYFDQAYIERQPEIARALGCEPDYDAYTGEANEPPDASVDFRTAAGHIHLGWKDPEDEDDDHFIKSMEITKQLDFILGVPSVMLDRDGRSRRFLYGKAGAFRPKPYGAEYRVLSNFWIKSEDMMNWVYSHTQKAFFLLAEEGINLFNEYGDVAQRIINCDDPVAANEFYEQHLCQYVDLTHKIGYNYEV